MTQSGYSLRLQRRTIVLAFVLAVAALSAVVWHYGYRQALDQVAQRAESDLELASDRLSTQLQIYQELAVLMAEHPGLQGLDGLAARASAKALLLEVVDKTAALDVVYADASGVVLVAAQGLTGGDLSQSRYFRRAMQGALGRDHGVLQPLNRAGVLFRGPHFCARWQSTRCGGGCGRCRGYRMGLAGQHAGSVFHRC